MEDTSIRTYSKLKQWPKRVRQALFRFFLYGASLIAGEVAFYTITKIGRSIKPIAWLFTYQWSVDPRFHLDTIWDTGVVPISSLYGQASLYMFLVYGAICVFGLEPAYRWLKSKNVPAFFRGVLYMFIILFMECLLGWVLRGITGFDIWFYADAGAILRYTSWAIAPMWFICGMISENVINLIDSFDALKFRFYGFDGYTPETVGTEKPRTKTVFLSDIHITHGRRSAVFSKAYPYQLAVVLRKYAYDVRVKELVLLGDIFDTWMYGVDERPLSIPEIIKLWERTPLMDSLKLCLERIPQVYYIPGNHDMEATRERLTIEGVEKQLLCVSPGGFNKLHANEGLYAEHGNRVDLFNAPDTAQDALCGLPLGYFMTRIACSTAEPEKVLHRISKERILARSLKEFAQFAGSLDTRQMQANCELAGQSSVLVKLIVDVLVAYANRKRNGLPKLTDETTILMGAENDSVTIGDIKKSYGSLFIRWFERKDVPFVKSILAAAGKHGLDWYADSLCGGKDFRLFFSRLLCRNKVEKIIVFGHTHCSVKSFIQNRKIPGLYVNTGCFCKTGKDRSPTWVEVVERNGKLKAFIRRF
ncbi:metallophosphoesterase [Treponema brennaborense]|uniref:Metallophosphoesterase n=1 Tax=Treponema brennaborense (strain DSM 12168 / CIP 105900 / DD5/3) TaxID=906968 RepID=F4LN16_TREBD|nr:metallophosphoesterase [Treponema brennaborense]AEE15802.1 metallophosphoesterase [Treponema brennaborense DSM 12168]